MYNLQFIWLPSTHSIINFTGPFYTLAWFMTVQRGDVKTEFPLLSQESAWMMCHLAGLALVGVTGLDFPFPSAPTPTCLSHLPTRPSPWRKLPWGWAWLILQLPSSTEPDLPPPFGSWQALRSAAGTGAKAEVSQGGDSRKKGRWQAFNAS